MKEKASGASLEDLNELKFESHARDNPTMWQSIIKQKGNENMNNPSFQNNEMNSFDFMDNMVSSTTVATDRMDHGSDLADGAFSVYPVYTVSPAPQNPVQRLNKQNTIPYKMIFAFTLESLNHYLYKGQNQFRWVSGAVLVKYIQYSYYIKHYKIPILFIIT